MNRIYSIHTNNDNNASIMTKLGLRDSVLTLTLIPTVIIGLLLGKTTAML